ncbi:transketolase [Kaistia algarum]|uniref:transketolase n=1 Tax=Kaistia algarum TaxID=2083279 RepID=UPI000CE85E2D|nr:transketolase [Kaistia algarum]MCX5514014.1 transketolase [Kaistia algarum]PPE77815.1 transketolase [Kaistia algarum]
MKSLARRDIANAIRFLTVDVVQEANSGHPGTAMGMADIAEVLWNDFLKHNPANPHWANRDRFVQSNGHGSMLIYSLLHLSGYGLTVEDLRRHRKLHSKTPGHPEYGITAGVETTTGPLGQGFANAVGMALAERKLAAEFNRDGFPIVDHTTYVFVGDGCLMEGVAQEAASLAGALRLSKLIAVYDDNNISIDGEVGGWFADDTPARFRSLGWNVIADVDGHDPKAVSEALALARQSQDRPTMICCKTIIGFGAPNKQGKEEAHGAPLGADEVALTRQALNWDHPAFFVPDDIYAAWDARARGAAQEAAWNELFAAYRAAHPELAAAFERRMAGEVSPAIMAWVEEEAQRIVITDPVKQPIRRASSRVAGKLAGLAAELIGGSADVSVSTLAWTSASRSITASDFSGNFLHYGVREFGMSAIMNGMAAHGGLVPYGSSYLVFSDYSRNAVRMAALMGLRSIFLYTHDSIGVGEDGPTHQPVEQIVALRAIPNISVWRPGSELEALVAWHSALERKGPSVIIAARQDGAVFAHGPSDLAGIRSGGYVLRQRGTGKPDIVLAATGSELALALAAADRLEADGLTVRVVSIPNGNLFAREDEGYRNEVLATGTPAVFVEAGSPLYWHQFLKGPGTVVGVESFGESAPGPEVYRHLGVTADRVIDEARRLLATR